MAVRRPQGIATAAAGCSVCIAASSRVRVVVCVCVCRVRVALWFVLQISRGFQLRYTTLVLLISHVLQIASVLCFVCGSMLDLPHGTTHKQLQQQ